MEDPEVKRLMEVDSRFRDQVQAIRKAQKRNRWVFFFSILLVFILTLVIYQSGKFYFRLSHDSKNSRSSPMPQNEHRLPMPPGVQPGLPAVMGVDPVKVYLSAPPSSSKASPKDSNNAEKKDS